MDLNAKMREIRDRIGYNSLRAPNYPQTHRTTLEKERHRIQTALEDVIRSTRREDVGDWLRLGAASVDEGFRLLHKGDEIAGQEKLENALQYLENALSKKPFKTDFVVGPDGTVSPAD